MQFADLQKLYARYREETEEALLRAAASGRYIGGEEVEAFARELGEWMGVRHVVPVANGTDALQVALMAAGLRRGDEVIVPSFTYVASAEAVALLGLVPVFADVDERTFCLTRRAAEAALTPRTRAIVPVHYAGVCCDMDALGAIAREHGLALVEDAAQAVGSFYHGRPAGSMSDVGCFSFHETKNYSMGEGGAILIRDIKNRDRAELIREKGTDRSKFWRGEVDKYTWVDFGSSYLPSDMNAAYLWAQLELADEINDKRLGLWDQYRRELTPLADQGKIELPHVPEGCVHNAHMFYIKTDDIEQRSRLISYLKGQGIGAVFHYIPLHTVAAGRKYGIFHGQDRYTTRESERLLRLPLHNNLTGDDVSYVCRRLKEFYG